MERRLHNAVPNALRRLWRPRRHGSSDGVVDVSCVTRDVDEPAAPRKRALTPPLPEDRSAAAAGQTRKDQVESLLFTKLPLELRLRIYHEVIGGMVIHILKREVESPHLRHVVCRVGHQQAHWRLRERCWKREKGEIACLPSHENPSRDHLLALPMTCRQIYSEAIDVLYFDNTFNIGNDETVSQLRFSLLPQRVDRIGSLEIFYPFFLGVPYSGWRAFEQEPWERMWREVLQMKGLQHLYVRIEIVTKSPDVTLDPETEDSLLQPLQEFNWLQRFEVDVSWLAAEDNPTRAEQWPFRLTRHTAQLCTTDPVF